MLPDGWKRFLLHEVAEVRSGLAKGRTNFVDPIELPYLRVANVQDGHLDLTEVKTIFVERSQVDRYSLNVGDILMTEGGDFDKLGRGDVWQGQLPVCLHQNHVFAVRPDSSRLNSKFLAALAASAHGRNYFLSCAKRSTNLASINASQLKSFPVLMPSLPEQEKIAEIIEAWNTTLSVTEQLHANSQRHKRAVILDMLSGARRHDGGTDVWKEVNLEDVCSFYKGGGLSKSDLNEDGARKCILYGELFTTYGEVIDRVVSRTNAISGFSARNGDVLIPTATTTVAKDLAKASALLVDDVLVGGDAIVMRPDSTEVVPEFLAYVLSYGKQREIAARAQGATIVHLSANDLRDLRISVPSLSEQRVMTEIFRSLNDKLASIERQLVALRREKGALIQNLLTGKRRVHLPQPAEAEIA